MKASNLIPPLRLNTAKYFSFFYFFTLKFVDFC